MHNVRSVIARIRSNYLTLLASERRIADFIVEHPVDAAQMSIDQISEKSQVSKTTVTRFCRKLGYEGYRDFKYALILSMADDKDIFQRLDESDSAEAVLRKVSASNCAAIEHTKDILDLDALEQAAGLIGSAQKVLLLANGGSSVVALDFYHKFMRLGINCHFGFDSRMQEMSSRLVTENDIAIGFTFSGGNKEVIHCMHLVANKGGKTICFTNTLDSPITKACDVVLCASNSVKSKITGSIEPRIALLNVVDSLFMLYAVRNSGKVKASLAETLEVLEETRLKD
jgi:RpiR family carbohydrate utilization transcriptional regulator